jgi:hypothetical protein
VKFGIALVALAAAATAAPDCLALVDLAADRDVFDVADLGIPVLIPLDKSCLVRVKSRDLDLLDAAGFEFRILDGNPADKQHVYAMPDPELDPAVLALYGTVLARDRNGYVLRTTEQGIRGLNTLQVELAGINMHPLAPRTRAPYPCPAVVDDSLVRKLVSRVSADTVESLLVRMREFVTRYSETDSCRRAMEWVRSRFEAWACSTFLDTFQTGWAPNAIGIKLGTTNPDVIFVVCGHTDATSEIPFTLTPGSEDNASGTAAVMELCRVTADMEFENTVWFIGFAGEEQGLVGSDSYARQARDRGDSIVLSINFDMISYGRENKDTIVIYGARAAPGSEQWVDFFIAQADTFTELKHRKTMENIPQARSDHYSFWKYGFPAIRGGYSDKTPHYHTTGDTIGPLYYAQCGTNNIPMQTEVIKALVAAIAKLGGAHVPVGIQEQPRRPAARVLEVFPTVGPAPVSVRLSGPLDRTSTIDVYDAAGFLVRRLDCYGCSAVSWDGTDLSGRRLPSGIYLFRITGPGHSSVARAVLTR